MNNTAKVGLAPVLVLGLAACGPTNANVVSRNIAVDSERFLIERRIVATSDITGEHAFMFEGRCSSEIVARGYDLNQVEITCKVAENEFLKHLIMLSETSTLVIQQLGVADVNEYRYVSVFSPGSIVPDVRDNRGL